MKTWDVIICGAGVSGATAAAVLRRRGKSVLVLETRDHIGGNCFDYVSRGTLVSAYGPHIFHSPNEKVIEFLGEFTGWKPYDYSVSAEVEYDGDVHTVPFPYCRATARALGVESLSPDEIIDLFFRKYSKRMWGREWEDIPASVKGRVPKDTGDRPHYFPGQQALAPVSGFTAMCEKMLDGVEVILSADPRAAFDYDVDHVIWCGRLDHLVDVEPLPHRSLDIEYTVEPPRDRFETAVLNVCHGRGDVSRITKYAKLTGGQSDVCSIERPKQAALNDPAPYYPIPTAENLQEAATVRAIAAQRYPNLIPLGRLPRYSYLDIWMACAAALEVASKI
jgi:UDP-galactopyranose mutase